MNIIRTHNSYYNYKLYIIELNEIKIEFYFSYLNE